MDNDNFFGVIFLIVVVAVLGYGIIKVIQENQAYIIMFLFGCGVAFVINLIIDGTLKNNEKAKGIAYAIYWSGAFISAVIVLVKTQLFSAAVAFGSVSWVSVILMLK